MSLAPTRDPSRAVVAAAGITEGAEEVVGLAEEGGVEAVVEDMEAVVEGMVAVVEGMAAAAAAAVAATAAVSLGISPGTVQEVVVEAVEGTAEEEVVVVGV